MTKKAHKQKIFVTNKNLNWEIITTNFVTFKLSKDQMKLRMKNFKIMRIHWKNLILESFAKNQNIEGQIG